MVYQTNTLYILNLFSSISIISQIQKWLSGIPIYMPFKSNGGGDLN